MITCIFSIMLFSSFQAEKIGDMVPDKKTAIKIAEAVWLPIYGRMIYNEKPYQAVLVGDTAWLVSGSMPPTKKGNKNVVYIRHGGVAICLIRKKDGTILQVIHGK